MILTYKKSKILKILIITLIALASNAMEFCFKKGPPIHKTRLEIKQYLVSGEKVKIISNRHCLELELRPERYDFISKIIHAHYRSKLMPSTAPRFHSEFCKFKLKEETTVKEKTVESTSELIATSGDDMDLDLGGTLVEMTCHKKQGLHLVEIRKKGRKEMVNLDLSSGKWFDLSAIANLEGKKYSLMVIE